MPVYPLPDIREENYQSSKGTDILTDFNRIAEFGS